MSFLVGTPPSLKRDAARGRDQPTLRDMNPEQLVDEVKRLRKDLGEFEDRYQKSRADNRKLVRELAVYAQCHDADKSKILKLLPYKAQCDMLQVSVKDLEKARDDEHIKVLQSSVLLQQTEAKLAQAQQQIAELPRLRSQLADATADLKDTTKKLADTDDILQQAQDDLKATQQELKESRQQMQDLTQQLYAEQQQSEKVQQELKGLQEQYSELQQLKDDAETRATAAVEQARVLKEQVAELQLNLQESNAAEAKLQAVVEGLQEAASAADAAREEVRQLQEQTQVNTKQLKDMEQLLNTVQLDMDTAKAELAGSEANRETLQQQLAAAECSKQNLQQQLAEAEHDNKAQQASFRQQQAELLNDVHHLQGLLASLSRQLQAAEQEQPNASPVLHPEAHAIEAAAERIAALEQELTGMTSALAAAEQQVEALSADLAAARADAHIAAVSISEHEGMLASLQQELTQAQQQLITAQKGSMTAVLKAADDYRRAGLSKLADQEQQETQSCLQELNEQLRLQVANLQQELTSARESLADAAKRAEDVDSQAGEQASRLVHMQRQVATQQAALQEKQQLLKEATDGQQRLQDEMERLQKEFDRLTEDKEQLLSQLEDKQRQVDEGKHQVSEAQQLAARSTAETSLSRREVGTALREVALVRTELGSMRSTLSTLSAELTAEESGLSAIELEADRLRIQLKNAAADTAAGSGKEAERAMFEYYSGRAGDIMKQLQGAKSQQVANRAAAASAAERLERLVAYLVAVSQRLANLTNDASTADNSRASSMPGALMEEALTLNSLQQQLLQQQLLHHLQREDDEVESAVMPSAAGLPPPLAHLQHARTGSSASGTSYQPDLATAGPTAAAGSRDLPATPASTPAHSMMGSSGTPYQTPWPATALAMAMSAAAGAAESPLTTAVADVAPFPVAAVEAAAADQGQAAATSPTAAAAGADIAATHAPSPSESFSWRLHPAFSPARSASAPTSAAVSKQQQQEVSPAALDQLLAMVNRAGEQYETPEDFQVALEAVTGVFAVQDQQQLLQQQHVEEESAESQPVVPEAEQAKQHYAHDAGVGALYDSDDEGSISLERGILQQQQQQHGQGEWVDAKAADQDRCSSVVSVAGGGGSTVAGFISEQQCEDEGNDNVMFKRFLEGASTIGSTEGSVHSVKSAASGSSSSAALAAAAPADAQQQQLMQQHAMATIAAAPKVGGVQLDVGDSPVVDSSVTAGRGVNSNLDDSPPTPHFWRHPAVVSSASQRSVGSTSSTRSHSHQASPSRSSRLRSQSEPATPESVLKAVAQGLTADQGSQALAGDTEGLDSGASFSSPLMFMMSPVGMTPQQQQQQQTAGAAAAAVGSSGSPGSISVASPTRKAVPDSPGSSTLSGVSFGVGSPSPANSPWRDGFAAAVAKGTGSSSNDATAAGTRPRAVPRLNLNLVQPSISNSSGAGASRPSGSFSGFHGGSSVGDVIPIPEVPTGESDVDEATSVEQQQQQRWPLHESDHGGDGLVKGDFAGFAGDVSVGDVIPIPPVPSDDDEIGTITVRSNSSSSSDVADTGRSGAQQELQQQQPASSNQTAVSEAASEAVRPPAVVLDLSSAQAPVPPAAVTPGQQQQQTVFTGATPGPEAYHTAQPKAPWMSVGHEDGEGSSSPVVFGGFDTEHAAVAPAAAEDIKDAEIQQQQQQQQQQEESVDGWGSTPEMRQQQKQEFFTCVPDTRNRPAAAASSPEFLQQVTNNAAVALGNEKSVETFDNFTAAAAAELYTAQQQLADVVAAEPAAYDAASEAGSSSGAVIEEVNVPEVPAADNGNGDDDNDGESSQQQQAVQMHHDHVEVQSYQEDAADCSHGSSSTSVAGGGVREPGVADAAVGEHSSGKGGIGSSFAEPVSAAAAVGPPEPEGPSAIKQLVKRLDFNDESLASSDPED